MHPICVIQQMGCYKLLSGYSDFGGCQDGWESMLGIKERLVS